MIWILVLLSLNLPEGRVPDDMIRAITYRSSEECNTALQRVAALAQRENGNLNAVCVSADNIDQRLRSGSVKRPT